MHKAGIDELIRLLEQEKTAGGAPSPPAPPLNPRPGGGTSPPMPSDDLKPRVDFLHTAFLWLAGIMVTGFIALVTVTLTVNSGTNTRVDKATEAVSALNREVGVVASKADETNRRLDRIEGKLDAIGSKLDKR